MHWFDAGDPEDKTMLHPNEKVLFKTIYITNDEGDGLYYSVVVPESGMTRRQLARKITHWLVLRNVYYNLATYREKNKDVTDDFPLIDYASDLVIHELQKTGRKRKGCDVYNMRLSS